MCERGLVYGRAPMSRIRAFLLLSALLTPLVLIAPAAPPAGASASKPRHVAMRFALTQRGDMYRMGGNGPDEWDCSGLVSAAYRHAGIALPRTVADIRASATTIPVARGKARWGHLVVWGTSHIELFVKASGGRVLTFGAHRSGTRVGYRWQSWGSARVERVAGAG